MSKDKLYGYGIFFITIILLILYTIYVPLQAILGPANDLMTALSATDELRGLLVMWPVYLATLLIGFILHG